MKIFKGAGVSLKLAKCKFFTQTVQCLGHVLRPGKLPADEERTGTMRDAKPPMTQTELPFFLGLCTLCRRFVSGFAEVASPLNAVLKKGKPINLALLEDKELRAHRTLLDRIILPPILSLPKPDLQYSLDADARENMVGVAAFQIDESGRAAPSDFGPNISFRGKRTTVSP